jgi:putative ABC transport system ATP-binding protein
VATQQRASTGACPYRNTHLILRKVEVLMKPPDNNNPNFNQPMGTGPLNNQPPQPRPFSQDDNFGQYARLRLRFLEGPRRGEVLELAMPETPIFIGRNVECAVRIDATDVSRRHTQLFVNEKGDLVAKDLGSLNGTALNGQPISPDFPARLRIGDRITVGYTTLMIDGATGRLNASPIPPEPPTTTLQNTFVQPPPAPFPVAPSQTVLQPLASNPVDEDSFIYIILRSGQRYLFKGDEAIVGRGPTSDIIIENNSISRNHARLQRTPNGIYVSDMGSTNKTFVNNASADMPTLLQNGDLLRFGDVEADFKIEDNRLSQVFDTDMMRKLRDMVSTTEEEIPENTVIDMGTQVELPGLSNSQLQIQRSRLEEGETNINFGIIDAKVVGRSTRASSNPNVTPGPTSYYRYADDGTRAGTIDYIQPGGNELARLEGVYYTEGAGRSAMQVLSNIRLSLRERELVALFGPSGSGKSEVLLILAGLLAADKGSVSVLGFNLPTTETNFGRRPNVEENRDIQRWRMRYVGYMSSSYSALNVKMSVLDHVTQVIEQGGVITDTRQRRELAIQRLQMVGLRDNEVLNLRPNDLSRREKSLLALARTIANDPPIILADEPMGNLHSKEANVIFELLQQFVAGGKSVFMVTQDREWARLATRQIEILDGTIVGGIA